MTKTQNDFRIMFARMADQAIMNRAELAELINKSAAAVSQMAYRGELPPTAFPAKRRACWFVRDIRAWLDAASAARPDLGPPPNSADADKRIGRPRLTSSGKGEH